MSTAHIFYIPVILVVGIFAGYYIGRWQAEQDELERIKRAKRKQKLQQKDPSPPAD